MRPRSLISRASAAYPVSRAAPGAVRSTDWITGGALRVEGSATSAPPSTSDDQFTRGLNGCVTRCEGGPNDGPRGGHGEAPSFAQLLGEEKLGVAPFWRSGSQNVLNGT